MLNLRLSKQLNQITKNYRFVQDTQSMSPARVYKLIGRDQNLYLKISSEQYQGTTYDVEREKDMMIWLQTKLNVPEVLHFEKHEGSSFLLMSEVDGVVGHEDYEKHRDPERMLQIYSEGIKLFHSIHITDCPFDNSINNRLDELDYLLSHQLADMDTNHWEEDTPFKDPHELYAFLQSHKPTEELVFSHGDFCDSNIFIKNHQISGFIDLARSGKADKWYDIAFCVRSIRHDMGDNQEYLDLFFKRLELEPNWEKIQYYILLDELF
ncbi:MAG: APH(3') family aminoglycoside O-phosphotransferase [Anaerolineales bacterium]